MSWVDDIRCLHCDGKLPLYRKVTNGQFCSAAHRKSYWQEQERLGVERLTQTHNSLRAFRPAGHWKPSYHRSRPPSSLSLPQPSESCHRLRVPTEETHEPAESGLISQIPVAQEAQRLAVVSVHPWPMRDRTQSCQHPFSCPQPTADYAPSAGFRTISSRPLPRPLANVAPASLDVFRNPLLFQCGRNCGRSRMSAGIGLARASNCRHPGRSSTSRLVPDHRSSDVLAHRSWDSTVWQILSRRSRPSLRNSLQKMERQIDGHTQRPDYGGRWQAVSRAWLRYARHHCGFDAAVRRFTSPRSASSSPLGFRDALVTANQRSMNRSCQRLSSTAPKLRRLLRSRRRTHPFTI